MQNTVCVAVGLVWLRTDVVPFKLHRTNQYGEGGAAQEGCGYEAALLVLRTSPHC